MRRHRTREYKGLYSQGRRLPPMGLESVEDLRVLQACPRDLYLPSPEVLWGLCCPSLLDVPSALPPHSRPAGSGPVYDLDPLPPFPDHVQYTHYSDQIGKRPVRPQASPPALLPGSARLSQGSVGVVGRWESWGMVPCSVVTWGWGLA